MNGDWIELIRAALSATNLALRAADLVVKIRRQDFQICKPQVIRQARGLMTDRQLTIHRLPDGRFEFKAVKNGE